MKSPLSMTIVRRAVIGVGFAGTILGCSMRENASLEQARVDLQSAQQNPQLVAYAPTVLQEAATAYERADSVWTNTRNREETDHLVYITERTLQIAREETRRKLAQNLAQAHRDTAQVAAGSLRSDRDNANARANINGLVAEGYRQDAESNRQLVAQLNRQVLALHSKETKRGLEFTLSENVLFESNKSELKNGVAQKLAPLTNFLRRNPNRSITIEGHTDSIGTAEYNSDLSQKRAEAVRDLFITQGIASDRVAANGLGETYPLTSNTTESGRLQNRRVQIILSQPV